MAHLEKYGRSAVPNIYKHYDRTKPGKDSYINAKKTHRNLNWLEKEGLKYGLELFYRIIEDENVNIYKSSNETMVLCDWVVTLPSNVPPERAGEFFQDTCEYLHEKYPYAISAWVHYDETTPHVHYAFVPLVDDVKWNKKHQDMHPRKKVCSSELITRDDLKRFHSDLQAYLEERMGIPVEITNGITEGKNKSINQLKQQKETCKERQLKAQLKFSKKENYEMKKELKDANAVFAYTKMKTIEEENERLKKENEKLHKALNDKDKGKEIDKNANVVF